MSEVRTFNNFEEIKSGFDRLLVNLEKVLQEVRPRTKISSTKLWKIKSDLSNIENLDLESMAKVAELASKYNAINNIFDEKVAYNKKNLAKIIEGKSQYKQDSNEEYNDHFFELSMGVRFLLALKKQDSDIRINLDSVCDVIVGDKIAIECKYIHSPSNLVKNIQKAKKQIEKRIKDNQAEFGFIALDLSHLCPRQKVSDFANYTFSKFVKKYESLEARGHISGSLIKQIIEDRNFTKIIGSYIMSEVETVLLHELGFEYDTGATAKAIIFQSLNSFVFEYKGEKTPLATRGMSYFLSQNVNTPQLVAV